MKSKASKKLQDILKRISSTVKEAVNREALDSIGLFAVNLVVKRTRLGYGVSRQFDKKQRLAPLSPGYVKSRKMFEGLSDLTTPKRSNLTRTGQMLDSIRHKVKGNSVEIRPEGRRTDGKLNSDIAYYNAIGGKNRPRRVFMNISELEYKQILRFYRKTFGDLLRKRNVL